MFRSCMSPATTPLKPASASTPLTIISTRIDVASRLRTGVAKNIESAKKKKSQATMPRAYATVGHLKHDVSRPLSRSQRIREGRLRSGTSANETARSGAEHTTHRAGEVGSVGEARAMGRLGYRCAVHQFAAGQL
jgi:hypothetical protein